MNLMNLILEQAVKSLSNGPHGAIVQAVLTVVQNNGGTQGITTLVQQFEKNGLGEIVQSWLSTGPNMPVSAEQIQQGLGDAHLQQIAYAANITPSDAAAQLSKILPQIIDKLSPNGQLDTNMVSQVLNIFNAQKAA
ncbi:MAG: YidB family protein [Alphaproteobacteria bacterium]|nr:YidB family protein [Alphaproteobacteria bacterium]